MTNLIAIYFFNAFSKYLYCIISILFLIESGIKSGVNR